MASSYQVALAAGVPAVLASNGNHDITKQVWLIPSTPIFIGGQDVNSTTTGYPVSAAQYIPTAPGDQIWAVAGAASTVTVFTSP